MDEGGWDVADPPHGSDTSDVPPGVGESFRRLLHRCGPRSPRRSPVVLTIPTGAHGCSRGTEGLSPPSNLPPLRRGSEFRRAMRRTTPPSPPLQIFPSPAEDRAIHPCSKGASSSSSTARATTWEVRPRGNLRGVGACFGACFGRPFSTVQATRRAAYACTRTEAHLMIPGGGLGRGPGPRGGGGSGGRGGGSSGARGGAGSRSGSGSSSRCTQKRDVDAASLANLAGTPYALSPAAARFGVIERPGRDGDDRKGRGGMDGLFGFDELREEFEAFGFANDARNGSDVQDDSEVPSTSHPKRKNGRGSKADGGKVNKRAERLARDISSLPLGTDPGVVLGREPVLNGFMCGELLKQIGQQGPDSAERAIQVFQWMIDQGGKYAQVVSTPVPYTIMFGICSREGKVSLALQLHRSMLKNGVKANAITYNALIDACGKSGDLQAALAVFDIMKQNGIAANVITYCTLISACGAAGHSGKALEIFSLMQHAGVKPNTVVCNALIAALERAKKCDEALDIYKWMQHADVLPDTITYNTLVSACGKAKRLKDALALFVEMRSNGVPANTVTYNSLITACEKVADWYSAVNVFERMRHEGVQPNVITFNALISACEKGRRWDKAVEFFEQMQRERISPNTVTYNALISACERSGKWQLAHGIFTKMKQTTNHPDTITYNAVLSALCKGNQFDLVFETYNEMKARGVPSDHATQETLKIALESMGREEQGMDTSQLLHMGSLIGYGL